MKKHLVIDMSFFTVSFSRFAPSRERVNTTLFSTTILLEILRITARTPTRLMLSRPLEFLFRFDSPARSPLEIRKVGQKEVKSRSKLGLFPREKKPTSDLFLTHFPNYQKPTADAENITNLIPQTIFCASEVITQIKWIPQEIVLSLAGNCKT